MPILVPCTKQRQKTILPRFTSRNPYFIQTKFSSDALPTWWHQIHTRSEPANDLHSKKFIFVLVGQMRVKGKWKTKLPIHIWKPGPWTNSVQITCQLVIVYEIRNNTFQLKHFSQGKFSWQSEDIGVRFAVAVRKRSIKAAHLHFSGLCARNSVWHLVCAHW